MIKLLIGKQFERLWIGMDRLARPVAMAMALVLAPSIAKADYDCSGAAKHTLEKTRPLNVGQLKLQLQDYRHSGGYAQRTFKVPNPFYFIP